MIIVSIRWFDAYLEKFNCNEVRFGGDILFMRLLSGENRHVPLRGGVRWFSVTPESHENSKICNIKITKKVKHQKKRK